jgi:tetratricopeptide (TPR) repeat protein
VTDWVSASAILAAGIILGTMFVFFVKRRPASSMSVGRVDVELRDLEAKRDALVEQLRSLDPMNADERTRLEIETAQVLRRIDEHRKKTPAPAGQAGMPVVHEVTTSDPVRRATMIGFGWGAGSVLLLAILGYMVMQQAKTREPNAPVTGGETTTMAPAQAPPDPAVQQLEASVKASPDDLNMRVELAKAYLERDNLMAVFDQTQYVLKRSPNDARALTYQALVRMAMGQSADADGMLDRATKSDPSLLDAWVALAWAKTLEGKPKEAEAAIASASKNHPEEKARLEQVYAQMKQQAAAKQAGGSAMPVDHPQIGAAEAPVEQPIHVTLDLSPQAKAKAGPNAVLFVFARAEGVTAGPPAAVKRIAAATFPMTFDLSAADSMMGQPLPPRVRLEARLDSDGNAMTKDPNDPVVVQDGVALGTSVSLTLR